MPPNLDRVISSGISGASYYEGSFSNISRSSRGSYVAVSSRGNFFMTWRPGVGGVANKPPLASGPMGPLMGGADMWRYFAFDERQAASARRCPVQLWACREILKVVPPPPSTGQAYWTPHNRPATRRLQNMGFTPSERLWLTTKGGDLYYTDLDTQSKFEQAKLGSRGFGILDVNFANQKVGFACGGSGSLFKTGEPPGW